MPTVQEQIIVLKKTKLAEMDLIITGLSDGGHQVRAVAKGARKPGSRRGAHLELYSQSRLLVHQGRSSLGTVTEAQLVKSHAGCRSDIEHSSAAGAVAELVEALTRDAEPDPRLFALLDASFDALGAAPSDGLELLTAAALIKVAGQAGFLPNLDYCLICGEERASAGAGGGVITAAAVCDTAGNARVADTGADPNDGIAPAPSPAAPAMRFSFEQGGVICANCSRLESEDDPAPARDADAGPRTSGSYSMRPQPVAPELLDWVALLIRSRFPELAAYATPANSPLARRLLLFARDWLRTQVTDRNRSLDYLLSMA